MATASKSVTKRLRSEIKQMMMQPVDGVSSFPSGDNIFAWTASIEGSAGTVYEGLTYELSIAFPENYPYNAPTVKFTTPCFHPNVDNAGNICLDILKDKWSAAYSVRTMLISIQSLLGEPNNDSPLNSFAAQLWANQEEYKKTLLKKYAEDTAAARPAK